MSMPIRLFAFLLVHAIFPAVLGFAPPAGRRTIPVPTRSTAAVPTSPTTPTALSNSLQQAEQFLSESYPEFNFLLRQIPEAIQHLRESKTGFAILAPSDAAIDSLGPERLRLLEAACADPGLQPIVSKMVAYHIVSAPVTAENMGTYNVVSTRVGELPVEVDNNYILYVNGRRIVQSYQFEDRIVQNFHDANGNLLGSQEVNGGGKRCIIHEVDGLVCPEELWYAIYSQFESSSGVGAM